MKKHIITFLAFLCVFNTLFGQVSSVSYSTAGSTYNMNFNSMGIATSTLYTNSSGSAQNYTGINFVTDLGNGTTGVTGTPGTALNLGGSGYMNGWEIQATQATSGSNTLANSSNISIAKANGGNATAGTFILCPSGSTANLALGSLPSASYLTQSFGLILVNNTGSTLTSFTVSYDGEAWKGAGGTQGGLTFSYAIGSGYSNMSSPTFTTVSALAYNPTVATSGGLDGTQSANRTAGITAILTGISWSNGSQLVLKWATSPTNSVEPAIDNVSFSATGNTAYTWNGGANGNYQTATNWTPNRTSPQTSDILTFAGGSTITNVPTETDAGITVSGTGTVSLTPTSAGNTLTVSSTLTVPSGATLDVTTMSLAGAFTTSIAGTLSTENTGSSTPIPATTYGGTVIYGASAGSQTIVAANYNNLTIGSTSGNTTLAGSGTIGIAGNFTTGTGSSTYTIAGSTINFNGTGVQTVPAFNYNNLTISGVYTSNNLTLASGTIGVAGTFSTSGLSFTTGGIVNTGNTINYNGTGVQSAGGGSSFTYNNLTVSNTAATVTATGTITLASGLLSIPSTSSTLDLGTNSMVSTGTLMTTSSAGTLKIAYSVGNSPLPTDVSWTMSVVYYGTLATNASQYIARGMYSDLTINTVLSGTGNIIFPSTLGNPFGISGTFAPNATFGTGTYTFNSNTVFTFNGTGAQTIPSFNYNSLTISGARGGNTVTLSGAIGIAATFTPSATSVVWATTGSTINLNGNSAQTAPAFNYNNFIINNSAGVSLGSTLTVAGSLTLMNGLLSLGNSNLTLSMAPIGASANSYVNTNGTGILTIGGVGNNTTVFPIGTSTSYTPISFSNTTNAPNISVCVNSTFVSPPLNTNNIVNLQWTIVSSVSSISNVGFQYNDANKGSGYVKTGAILGIYTYVYNETPLANISGSNPYLATGNSVTLQTNKAYYAVADPNQLNPKVTNNGKTAATLVGDTYLKRANAMIDLWSSTHPVGGDLKYTGPYYWAKIYSNNERQYAIQQLDSIFGSIINDSNNYQQINDSNSVYNKSSSGVNFYMHSAMHGYLVTKYLLDTTTKSMVEKFVLGWPDLTVYANGSNTLNMRMNLAASEFLASEEWPNILDSKGHNATQIQATTKPYILATLNSFFHVNCGEADATIYLSTDMPYVRMLAEFAIDKDVKQAAVAAYQYMIASLLPGWNNGIYVATPTRNKSYTELQTGNTPAANAISALAWLYYGNTGNQFTMIPSLTVSNNLTELFWCAYQRNIMPRPSLLATYNAKQYPYEHTGIINDSTTSSYVKYIYQSSNFGLATQTEIPYKYSASQYAWKEIKRNVLAWQSDSADCVFSVCQDNPDAPTDTLPNAAGYGENPYQRVLQKKNAVIGLYNVPTTYVGGKLYRLYVPFPQRGIKARIDSAGWIYCNTGTMLFAFRTIEPYQWNDPKIPNQFLVKGYDILTLADTTLRRGGWILETSEIPSGDMGLTTTRQLNNFISQMQASVSFDTVAGYNTADNPEMVYHSLDGDVLDLTFFAPTVAYTNQYKVNGIPVLFNPKFVFNDPFMRELQNSDTLFLTGGNDTLVRGQHSVLNYTVTGSSYLQDFNSLPISNLYQNGYYTTQGPFELMNQGFKIIGGNNDGNNLITPQMDGWQVYKTTTSGITGIEADNGSRTDGYLKSYGDSASFDRSLGLLNTTTLRNAFGLIIRNTSGYTIQTCRIGYLGKQWRIDNSNTKQVLKCSYKLIKGTALGNGINQTGLADIPGLRFESLNTYDSIGAIEGNNSVNQKQLITSINGLNWSNRDYMIIRFDDSIINSHGLAIDNFTFRGDTMISLPLKLMSFTGVFNKGIVTLKWNTTNEQNIAGFEIERSIDNGVNFNTVGTIQSKNLSLNEYGFNDDILINASKAYYRIKIINQDGSFFYSNEVLINNSALGYNISIYPNPFKDYILVQSNNLNQVYIEIFDRNGKLVRRIQSCQSLNKIQVDDLISGVYLVRVIDESTGKSMSQKLIKKQ